jgi:hypothetical protein
MISGFPHTKPDPHPVDKNLSLWHDPLRRINLIFEGAIKAKMPAQDK